MSEESPFIHPNTKGYTVYSKSSCPFCTKVKYLLEEHSKEFNVINCDEYLIENKEEFLSFIETLTDGVKHRTFPMVFLDGKFIGGFTETKKWIEKENVFENLGF